jgi:RHS repeat-associated protein
MTDGTGTTSYAYHPVDGSTFGAGNLHTIDGPLGSDTIAHTYDALGRMKTQSINGAANTTTIDTYDALSRITQFTNPLGVFNQTYDPVNLMPKTVTAPNGLTTTLDYHPAAADLRLKEIKHTLAGNVALSKHVYDYKPAGNIKSWAQTLGTSADKTWAIAYDKADQLEAASRTESGAVTAQQAFRFDKIGNITSKQNGAEISKSTHNNRNQLTAQEPGGWMRVRGTTNEGASVKVKSNANPFTNAATTSADEFSAWVQATPGANTVTVEAKDNSPNANTRTQSWSVNITGQSRVPTYDLNGNMTANGLGQTYLWDAENRLVKISYADGVKTEFQYDGLSRRARVTERNASNTITSDKRYVWSGGNQPSEERDATTNAVTKRYFPQGEQRIGGTDAGFYYYTKDHLGSIREVTNSSSALVTRYDFDLWGKRTKLSGSLETEVGFTGHHHHAKSGLVLTWFRAYDAELGGWLSPDPMGEAGGMNLYGYVENDPLYYSDEFGLQRGNGGRNGGRYGCPIQMAAYQQYRASRALDYSVPLLRPTLPLHRYGIRTHNHHAVPMFLGGPRKGVKLPLPEGLHRDFHQFLARNLQREFNGKCPPALGGRGGSTRDWANFINSNPSHHGRILNEILYSSRSFDKAYGTNITQGVWNQIVTGP